MNNMNFVNKVKVSTSRSGHILDAVFCEADDSYLVNLIVEPDFSLSFFHKLIMYELTCSIPGKLKTRITFRNKQLFNSIVLIDTGVTAIEVKCSEPCGCTASNHGNPGITVADCVVCLVVLYFSVFSGEYDKMCPMVEKDNVIKDNSPWFNASIREARKKRWLAESR